MLVAIQKMFPLSKQLLLLIYKMLVNNGNMLTIDANSYTVT